MNADDPSAGVVSIVIPNLNGERLLGRCLDALRGVHAEVILVDNGSVDRSIDVARRTLPDIKAIQNRRNLGFAKACNQGADASRGSCLLFLNSDVVLSETCLNDLMEHARADREAAAWQPKLMRADGRTWDSAGSFFTRTGFLWHEGLNETGADRFPDARDVFALKGACMLVRTEAFRAVGGFDADFVSYFEDSDLCWRLWLAGWIVRYVPVCCAYHAVGATTTRLFSSAEIDYLSFRNRISSIATNAEPRTLAVVLPLHLGVCLGIAALFAVRGRFANAAAIVRAMGFAVVNRRALFARRRSVQQLRTRRDRDFLPRLTAKLTWERARRLLRMYLPRW